MKKIFGALVVFVVVNATAQSRNELGLLLGGTIVSSPTPVTAGTTVSLNSGLSYQATYAHWFHSGQVASVGIEVPFIAVPSQDVRANTGIVPRNYASLFITPGVRVKFAPERALSLWFSVGGGYARFAESTTLLAGTRNPFKTGTNKGALQYGGGVDLRLPFKLPLSPGLRGEVRDFFSGQPRLNAVTTNNGQHNVVASGGIVLHF